MLAQQLQVECKNNRLSEVLLYPHTRKIGYTKIKTMSSVTLHIKNLNNGTQFMVSNLSGQILL
jgi:hypothetical protein